VRLLFSHQRTQALPSCLHYLCPTGSFSLPHGEDDGLDPVLEVTKAHDTAALRCQTEGR
jgi:hypothetical protein